MHLLKEIIAFMAFSEWQGHFARLYLLDDTEHVQLKCSSNTTDHLTSLQIHLTIIAKIKQVRIVSFTV